jgi:hypothetical protein
MSFASDLFDLLKADAGVGALVGVGALARVYPLLAPADVARPYITWQRIASEPTELAGRTAGERVSVQLDCWADTFDAVSALGAAVRAAIEGSQGPIRGALENDTDFFEDASRLYRRLASYVLYHPAN